MYRPHIKLITETSSGAKGGNRRATSWRQVMRVKIFDLSWNVDLNRLENEINAFLAMLPSNAVKHV